MSADVDKLNWSGCGMSTGRSPAGIWTYSIIWFCLPLPVAGIFSLSSVMDDHPSLCLNNSSDGDFAKSKGASISLWTICCSFVRALSIYSSVPLWMKVLRSERAQILLTPVAMQRAQLPGDTSNRYFLFCLKAFQMHEDLSLSSSEHLLFCGKQPPFLPSCAVGSWIYTL